MDAHSVLPIETDNGGRRPAMTFVELVGMAADAIGPQTEPVRMAAIAQMPFEPPRRAVPDVRPNYCAGASAAPGYSTARGEPGASGRRLGPSA